MGPVAASKKLDIDFRRTCGHPSNRLNCMTAKEWIKSQLGVWQFTYESRDIRDKNLHPAVFPIALARKAIDLFTHEGELVLDPFVGSGTALVAAKDTNRNSVGFDLNRDYVELSNSRLAQGSMLSSTKQIAVCDDARSIDYYLEPNTVALSVTSPPYANLLNRPRLNKSRRGAERRNGQFLKVEQYSQDPRDLGVLGMADYTRAMAEIYQKVFRATRPGGHAVVNVADMWWENRRVPLHIAVIKALNDAGFEFRNTIIWDRTNIVNRIGIFGWPSNYITMGTTFEYILDFRKPNGP
jgi:DNA modification methylase